MGGMSSEPKLPSNLLPTVAPIVTKPPSPSNASLPHPSSGVFPINHGPPYPGRLGLKGGLNGLEGGDLSMLQQVSNNFLAREQISRSAPVSPTLKAATSSPSLRAFHSKPSTPT